MNIKKMMVIFILLFSFIISIPYNDNVSALLFEYNYGFEQSTVGNPVDYDDNSENIFTSEDQNGLANFCVSSNGVRTGSKSFYSKKEGWFNVTTFGDIRLRGLEMWLDFYSYTGESLTLSFYNSSLGIVDGLIIKIDWYLSTNDFRYYDEILGTHIFDSDFGTSYNYVGWLIEDETGMVTYYTDVGETEGVATGSNLITSGYKIDSIYWNYNNQGMYTDDWKWFVSADYEGIETVSCDIIHSGYYKLSNSIGLYSLGSTSTNPYIGWQLSGDDLDGYPHSFVFYVPKEQILRDNDLANYWLYINGDAVGSADCIYDLNSVISIIEWNISNIGLWETIIYVDIQHTEILSGTGGLYWFLALEGCSNPDQCYDAVKCLYSGNSITFTDINRNAVFDCMYHTMWDLWYSISGEGIEEEGDCGYDNLIIVESGYTLEEDYFNYEITQYSQLVFSTYVNRSSSYYNMEILNIDLSTVVLSESINQCWEYWYWTPDDYGNFSLNIERSDVSYYTVNVTVNEFVWEEFDRRYRVWSIPNPSHAWESYTIGCFLSNMSDYDHYYLYMWDEDDNLGDFDIYNVRYEIFESSLNSDNEFYYDYEPFRPEGIDYWVIYASNTGDDLDDSVIRSNIHKHYLGVSGGGGNGGDGDGGSGVDRIWTSLQTANIGYIGEGFEIYWVNTHLLSTVQIWRNNLFLTDVSGRSSGHYDYVINTAGVYTLRLMLQVGDDWIELDIDVITIQVGSSGGGGEYGINFAIPPPFNYFASIFLILVFTMSPLMIVAGVGKSMGKDFNLSSIPQFLYLIMGIIGFVFCIILNWLPSWSVIVLVSLSALIIAIMYLKEHSSSVG